MAVASHLLTLDLHKAVKITHLDLLAHPLVPVFSFLSFIGGNFLVPSVRFISLLAGIFMVATYILACYCRYYRKNPAWFCFFTYMLFIAALVACNRGEVGALRYRTYISMFPVLTVLFYYNNRSALRINKLFKLFVPCIATYSLFFTLLYIPKIQNQTENRKLSTVYWQYHKNYLDNWSFKPKTLHNVESNSIYKMPQIPLSKLQSRMKHDNWQDLHSSIKYKIDLIEEIENHYIVRGWAYTGTSSMHFTDIYLWLINGDNALRIEPLAERRYDLSNTSLATQENSGFCAIIPQTALPEGDYTLCIEIRDRFIVPMGKPFSILTEYKLLVNQIRGQVRESIMTR